MQKAISTKCPTCGNYKTRGVSIDAIIDNKNKVLLIKRAKHPYKNLWALPGGHLDWNETIEQTVIREVREETNLTVTDLKLFGVYSNPHRHPQQTIAIAYITKVTGAASPGDDACEVKYFSLGRLPEILAFDHAEIINNYLRRRKLG